MLARSEGDVRAAQRLRWRGIRRGAAAPASTRPSPGWTATASTRTAITSWCARSLPATWSAPTACCHRERVATRRRLLCRERVSPGALLALRRRAVEVGTRVRARRPSHRRRDRAPLERAAALPGGSAATSSSSAAPASALGDDMRPAAALCRRLVREHSSPPDWRVLPAPAAALRSAARRDPRAAPAAAEGLSPARRVGVRRAGLGPGFDTADCSCCCRWNA